MKTKIALLASLTMLSMGSTAFAQVDINALPLVTDEVLANPAAGDWPSYGRDITNYRFSPLDQFNTDNVGELTLVWARALEPGNMQAAPLEFGGVLFTAAPG